MHRWLRYQRVQRCLALSGMGAIAGLFMTISAPAIAQAPHLKTAEEIPQSAVPSGVNQSASAPVIAPQSTVSRSSLPASAAIASNRVVLSLEERRVSLYRGQMLVSSYPVAVGTDETPTPLGEFAVSQMLVNPKWRSPWTGEIHEPGPDSALGLRWIEFATSAEGSFGFHGTPTLESIGKAASNGCVRMRNEDVVALFSQVDIGTPVIVQP